VDRSKLGVFEPKAYAGREFFLKVFGFFVGRNAIGNRESASRERMSRKDKNGAPGDKVMSAQYGAS
jgi:hypothetical protein